MNALEAFILYDLQQRLRTPNIKHRNYLKETFCGKLMSSCLLCILGVQAAEATRLADYNIITTNLPIFRPFYVLEFGVHL